MYLCSYLSQCSFFLCMALSYFQVPFVSARKTAFSIACRKGLLLMNSPCFYLFGNVLFFLYFWRIVLANTEYLINRNFFSNLNIFPLLSGLYGFYEKSLTKAVNLTEDHLYVIFAFSVSHLKMFLFLFHFQLFAYKCVLVYISVFISLGVCWASLMCKFVSFIKFRKFSVVIYLNILSVSFSISSPSKVTVIHMLISFMVSHNALRFFNFLNSS